MRLTAFLGGCFLVPIQLASTSNVGEKVCAHLDIDRES
jgi:hypothetical protein